jgi:hypothetical protein
VLGGSVTGLSVTESSHGWGGDGPHMGTALFQTSGSAQ